MKPNNVFSLERDDQNSYPSKNLSTWPIPLPLEMPKRKTDRQKVYAGLIVIFLFVELAGLIVGMNYLFRLQQQLNQVTQDPSDSPKVPQKLIATKDKTKNDRKMAAHLTAKVSDANSTMLFWEDRLGYAFTDGVAYENGALVISETGYYFIYSRVYFRGLECEQLPLHQTVFKQSEGYPEAMILMETRVTNMYCVGSRMWGKNTYQAGIFYLSEGERLYVTVPNPRMVAMKQSTTCFGIYKL
ncbi:tumor necrosis factor ligand superfamily member 6-like [Callorhinchus milii]|uniref:Tumor necrosis factor ligand superfamily member 6 n=1 Tax=Callorhinchus milii TaxID=7868 RepID=A0A4W3JMZ4_CALMI|nr:Fas ligand member b [Callorhinchus milii]|eukprot:gi/632956124/ref/XP_007893803.1/ PREDICTED: tumor necrosis factor ligand superfamily member 6-like [Callorhinchus milii]